ncbi:MULTISPECIES: ATP synthase F1 subunit epsilon [Acetobacter]|uniref:ATP synthase epsilon chain n=1 Tax=Acetobacter thailandicus TaxID=1502842 RepID=A0ABT3QDR3_9PROT|nr:MULTISPECIES: ATP synthase F1 subunit epsilon [Acetobacter]MBS0960194.1 ATP synthase F1 subunit epsilon [Acetobacter thailandicus]MBS0979777.1 ATP synthase F1 subunit epsilon [Acetobacter thailandicus]MBS0985419.1 ATP synthase F1 subunit epsilon [Acetobacter thailandicus]MBS1004211.1 ATP synthase F1 subunit epsilon [Acetobacter thailandicus]MCX2563415.1 ATP synthase F1 subunit epsilon [Acetobacter thailandicus]
MPVQLDIISPEKVLVSREVEMAVIPGAEGDIAAMPEHAPVMLLLRGGVVSLYENGVVTDRFFVEGGFADITADRCTVLADRAVPVSEISVDEATARLEELTTLWGRSDKHDDPQSIDALQAQILSARAEIDAASAAH